MELPQQWECRILGGAGDNSGYVESMLMQPPSFYWRRRDHLRKPFPSQALKNARIVQRRTNQFGWTKSQILAHYSQLSRRLVEGSFKKAEQPWKRAVSNGGSLKNLPPHSRDFRLRLHEYCAVVRSAVCA
jgi:hypothetical protein